MKTTRRATTRRLFGRARTAVAVAGVLAAVGLAVPAAAAPTHPTDRAAAARTAAAELGDTVATPGVAWGQDASGRTLEVLVDPTVSGATLAAVDRLDARYGDAVTVRRLDAPLGLRLSGGDAIYGSGSRCTAGVNVRRGTTDFLVTAGHCTGSNTTWWTDAGHTQVFGTTESSSFPTNDYGLIRYTNSAVPRPGTIGTVDVTGPGDPVVGMTVCMRGSTSGVHCGTIQSLNNTVTFPEGTIYGLIRTNICAEPGDSGAPLYAGTKIIGILVGGTGNCSSGGTTYFQPIQEILSVYGLTVT